MHKIPVVCDFSGKFDSIQGVLELNEGVSSSMAACMANNLRYEIIPQIRQTDHGFEIVSVAISAIPADEKESEVRGKPLTHDECIEISKKMGAHAGKIIAKLGTDYGIVGSKPKLLKDWDKIIEKESEMIGKVVLHIDRDKLPKHTDENFEDWVRYCVLDRLRLPGLNPLLSIEFEAVVVDCTRI